MANDDNRGLASADEEIREEVAQKGGEARAQQLGHEGMQKLGKKGGQSAQKSGHAHKLSQEDRSKGGQTVSQDREHMSEIGKKGGEA